MSAITLRVNGAATPWTSSRRRRCSTCCATISACTGPRFGCGLGQCGACTVLIKGEAVRSCVRPVSAVQGVEITTLEGLADERQAASGAAGLDRRAGAAVRLLPERADPHRQGAARSRTRSPTDAQIRQGMQGALCRCMTYYRVQAAIKRRGRRDRRRQRMTSRRSRADRALAIDASLARDFLKSRACSSSASALRRRRGSSPSQAAAQPAPGPYPDPDFRQLDSWIVIRQDNTATFYVGKTDLGQGTGTAFRQIMSDELDIAYDKTSVRDGQHRRHRRSGRIGRIGRAADRRLADAPRRRRSAPRAARHGVDAARRAGRSELVVSDGVVSVAADPPTKVTYGELIGGRRFNVTLDRQEHRRDHRPGAAQAGAGAEDVGQSPQRYDIPAKVDGSLKWAVDVKLPGMVHARNVKPPVAGATLVSIDESSVRGIPGFVKVVSKGNYVAVVCEREEQAIRAARQLKVTGRSRRRAPFPASDDLFNFMRGATPTSSGTPTVVGDPDAASARRRDGRRGRLRRAVPGPHGVRPGARDGRSVERSADDLLERHEVVRPAQRRRRVPADAARSRARRLDGRAAGLRPHGRGRCRVRGGVSGEGDRPAGARAVDAPGRNGVGHEGPGLRVQDARRARRRRATSSRSTTTRAPPITIISATTSTTRC